MNTYVVVNQARMTSTRLPGKVLKEVLGRPLLGYQIERIKSAKRISGLVIATTTNVVDDAIVRLCEQSNTSFYRGSELDVLDRYYHASKVIPTSHVIRVTSDCPLIDPAVIDLAISQFEKSSVDYFSNSEAYTVGMNVEIFSVAMLDEAQANAKLSFEREHVTPYFYTHPELFKVGQAKSPIDYEKYRLTVDTPEDFELIRILLERLLPQKKNFSIDDVYAEFQKEPQLAEINSHVVQKKYTETQAESK